MKNIFKVGDCITWSGGDFGRISRIESDNPGFEKLWCQEWYHDKDLKMKSFENPGFIFKNDAILVKRNSELTLSEEIQEIKNPIEIFEEIERELVNLKQLADKHGYDLVKKEK